MDTEIWANSSFICGLMANFVDYYPISAPPCVCDSENLFSIADLYFYWNLNPVKVVQLSRVLEIFNDFEFSLREQNTPANK